MASLPGSGTASGDPHQFYEPQARFRHCCYSVGQNVYVYGHSVHMTVPLPSGVVDVFNLPSGRWQQLPTTGPPAPGVHGSVCAVVGNCAFFFGGLHTVDGVLQLYNTIHKLDVISMHWKELEPAKHGTAPMEKYNAGMVSYYESNLLVFSGCGRLPADPHTGPANYVPSLRLAHLRLGWTNELHLFDLQSRTWSVPETTGTPPPGGSGCSFTRVDKHRGVVFGGVQQDQLLPNHIHILNFQSWHWLKVESSGASGQPWPATRIYHTAVSVCDPDGGSPHPALLVCWGQKNGRALDDTWMLSLNTCQWKQVTLPSALRGRAGHTTAVVHHDDHHKQLVHFGGLHEFPPVGLERSAVPVAETTIVELESSGHPGDWVATRVNQLGRTVAGGDGVAMASHHLPLGGIRQPPFQSPLYRPEMPPIQLPLIDYPAQPSAMMPDLESFSFLDPLETLELLPPTQPQSWPPVPHPLPLTSMQPGPVGSQSTQTGYAAASPTTLSQQVELPLHMPSPTIAAICLGQAPPSQLQQQQPTSDSRKGKTHTRITPQQLVILLEVYNREQRPSKQTREELMAKTGLDMKVIQVWFQNRRSKEKRDASYREAMREASSLTHVTLPSMPPPISSTVPAMVTSAIPVTASSDNTLPSSLPGIGAIVKREPKKSESPPHLKEEPQSPEVKSKMKTEERGYKKVEEVVPAEKMRQLQLAYELLYEQHEELKEKMEYIIGSQSDIPLKKAKEELYEHTVKPQGEATEDTAIPTPQPATGTPTTHLSSSYSKKSLLAVKETKGEPSSPQLKEEPQSPGEVLDMGYEETNAMILAENRQIQMENKQLRDENEELRAQMDHIFRIRSETAEDVKTIGDTAPPKKVKEEATSSETVPVLRPGEKVWQAYLQLQAEHEKLKKQMESQEHIIKTYEEATVDVQPTDYKEFQEEDTKVVGVIKTQGEATGDVRMTGCLRRVDVIGETSLSVTNEAQTFHWEGYGLKLHIPPASLPAGVGQSSIDIKASLAGQFHFPENTTLVSAVYSLHSPVEFSQPIAVEIQHCATPSDDPSLTFAHASQEDPPYKFTALEGGLFPTNSCYACIQLKHFSKYGIIIWNFLKSLLLNWRYRAHIYYTRETVNTWMADFVVTHDLEACITSVQKKYGEAKAGPKLGVTFESDEITLQMPREGFTLPDHWTITPLTHPGIAKEEVDSYKCGQVLPSCQLRIKWRGKGTPDDFECMVGLSGAKEPRNFFLIALECESTTGDVSPPFQRRSLKRRQELTGGEEGKVASEMAEENKAGVGTSKKAKLSKEEAPPFLAELRAEPELPHFMNLVAAHIPCKWRLVGIQLHLKDSELDCIEVTSDDPLRCFSSVFTLWKRKETRLPLSWWTVLQALEAASVGEQRLARQVTSKLTTPSHD